MQVVPAWFELATSRGILKGGFLIFVPGANTVYHFLIYGYSFVWSLIFEYISGILKGGFLIFVPGANTSSSSLPTPEKSSGWHCTTATLAAKLFLENINSSLFPFRFESKVEEKVK